MQILIGCAKDMTTQPQKPMSGVSVASFIHQARQNAIQMMAFEPEELQEMLNISPKLAREIKIRYMHFLDEGGELPAIQAYTGVVFKHLGLNTFSPADYDYAQTHLWITSFLYGLLRPLDGIKPYRLEGRVKLPQNRCNMFTFWKSQLTDYLINAIKSDDGILVDLASKEMRNFFDWKRIEHETNVIAPEFLVNKQDQIKVLSVYAKQCRGEMCGTIIRKRIYSQKQIEELSPMGFKYAGDAGNGRSPVFILKQ